MPFDEFAPQVPSFPDITCDIETVHFDPVTEAERRLKTRIFQNGKMVDLYKESLSLEGQIVPWRSKGEIFRFFNEKSWVTLKLGNHQYQIWDVRKQVFINPTDQMEYWYPDFRPGIEEGYNLVATWLFRWAAALGWKTDGGFYFTAEDFVSLEKNGSMIADDHPDLLVARIDNLFPDFYLIPEGPIVVQLSVKVDDYDTPYFAMKFFGQIPERTQIKAAEAMLLEEFPAFSPKF